MSPVNPFAPKSDKHLISSYNITPESHSKVMKKKGSDHQRETLDCRTNSPCQHLRKCKENSMENMHIDVRV